MEDIQIRMKCCKLHDLTGFVIVNYAVIIKVTCLFNYSRLHFLASRGVTIFVGANKRTFALTVLFKIPQSYLSSSPLYVLLNINYAQPCFLVETIFVKGAGMACMYQIIHMTFLQLWHNCNFLY